MKIGDIVKINSDYKSNEWYHEYEMIIVDYTYNNMGDKIWITDVGINVKGLLKHTIHGQYLIYVSNITERRLQKINSL